MAGTITLEFDSALHQSAYSFAAALIAAGLVMPDLEAASEDELIEALGLRFRNDPAPGENVIRVEPSDRCLETVSDMCLRFRDQRRAADAQE